jgi:hypothetical protein
MRIQVKGRHPVFGHRAAATLALVVVLGVSGCGGSAGSTPTPSPLPVPGSGPAASGRPASPAVVRIVSPQQGQVVKGPNVHIVVAVDNATVVQSASTRVRPDEGHVHLYLDNSLTYMSYTLQQDLPVTTGTYFLKAEFVAADHAPFSPRVWSDQIVFTVP